MEWIDHSLFIHSVIKDNKGFQCLVITNKATTDISEMSTTDRNSYIFQNAFMLPLRGNVDHILSPSDLCRGNAPISSAIQQCHEEE